MDAAGGTGVGLGLDWGGNDPSLGEALGAEETTAPPKANLTKVKGHKTCTLLLGYLFSF